MFEPRKSAGAAVLLGAALSLVAAASAQAIEITPNTLGDEYNADALTCSLREAVQASNTDAAFNGCPAGSGLDEIVLGNGVYEFDRSDTGTGNDNGDLEVTTGDSLTISHAGGSRSVIDALDVDRVFNVEAAASLAISGVELRGGRATSQNGGGVANQGILTMTNATVADNEILTGGYGAGIWSFGGTVNLTNVTISGNTAPPASPGAGGIYLNTPGNVLTNVTITNNNGGGGAGGGINLSSPAGLTIQNTIIAGNLAGSSVDCWAPAGTTVSSLDNNLIGSTPGCTTYVSQSGDVQNEPAGVSALADNGGPVSTHALLPGSKALDLADGAECAGQTADARGYPRPASPGGSCDAGAYELLTCSGTPLNATGPFAGCPQPQVEIPVPTPPKKCKKGRKLKKGKCVKKKKKRKKR
jgi:CSLREA domain-containing protein